MLPQTALQCLLAGLPVPDILQQLGGALQPAPLGSTGFIVRHCVKDRKDCRGGAWYVLLKSLLAVSLLAGRLHLGDLPLELQRALHDGLLHRRHHLIDVITDVLLPRTLERDLCGDDADENTNLIAVVIDLVGVPVYAFGGGPCNHVRAAFKKQWDSVCVSEHVDAGLQVLPSEADPGLHNECMSFKDLGIALIGGNHVWPGLLHDAKAEVVLPCWAEMLAVGVTELGLPQELVETDHLHVFQVLG
mmetsp:Transcript_2966/g.8350  ORF Transcript_2966/g.8350 Transcript_2966/m.8350 type:complete len:246 (-) Transcript_2966:1050-1787(-)